MSNATKRGKLKQKGRILLVDDDPGLLRLLSIRLRAENYIVEAVESAMA
ncbi:MAG: two-component system response regulator GlrR, partial [Pseudomonadota bacterium]